MKKLTRQQKAAITRKANTQLKNIERKISVEGKALGNQVDPSDIGKTLRIKLPNDYVIRDSPALISLSKALDNSLDRLELRMADYIARVDRILA